MSFGKQIGCNFWNKIFSTIFLDQRSLEQIVTQLDKTRNADATPTQQREMRTEFFWGKSLSKQKSRKCFRRIAIQFLPQNNFKIQPPTTGRSTSVGRRRLLLRRGRCQGCQMDFFSTKNPNVGKFWTALELNMLVHLMAIWNI
jgi:hypothetical protein